MEENNEKVVETAAEVKETPVVNEVKEAEKVVATEVKTTKPSKKKKGGKGLIIAILVLVIAVAVAACVIFLGKDDKKDDKKEEETTKTSSSSVKKSDYYITGNSLEKFDLYFLQLENEKVNKIYSPLSIKYALEMLAAGANGDSEDQILSVIGEYTARKYENSENMSFANGLFINELFKDEVKDDYVTKLSNSFAADVIYDPFTSSDNINEWIKKKTLGLIKNAIDYVTPETQYVLVNALGIDMEWKNVIQPIYKGWSVDYKHHNYYAYVSDLTSSYYSELDFEGKSSKAVTIGASIDNYDIINDLGEESIRNTVGAKYEEFLASGECDDFGIEFPDKETYLNQYIEEIGASYGTADSSTDFMIYSDSDYKVFAKDLKEYNGVTLQYIGIMPQTKDLDEFIKSASVDEINSLIKSLKSIKNDNFKSGVITRITGKIPLFSYDYQLELQKDLESLGITDVFDVDKADLSNIASTKSYIASATHKANIEFSNEGIKAAAATTMGGYGASSCEFEYLYDVPVEEIDMTFDHPFMYIIRDKATGEVWFVGTVYEPTEYSFDALGY